MITVSKFKKGQKKVYNQAVSHPVQSWEWGEFRKKTGIKVLRFGIWEEKRLRTAFQLFIYKVPHTPLKIGVLLKGPKPTRILLRTLKGIAIKHNLLFIRMEPNVKWSQKLEDLLKDSGAVTGRPSFTKETFIIDLTKPEKKLLASMHHKTRYNIRLAIRKRVKIKEDNSQKAFEKYLDLLAETTKRQNFFAHTESYHRLMWQYLKSSKPHTISHSSLAAHLLTAVYQGKILATWILFIFKDTLYYPYGASSVRYRNVMASHALMWGAIKFGKRLGLKKFDLWGKKEGKGFTRFKEGFGPETVRFLGTWDIPTNKPLYYIFRILETLRWIILKAPLPFPKPPFRHR